MLRKLFIITVLTILGYCFISGCDKTSNDSEPEGDVEVKSQAEYEAEAKEQITEENMEQELADLENQIDKEINEDQ